LWTTGTGALSGKSATVTPRSSARRSVSPGAGQVTATPSTPKSEPSGSTTSKAPTGIDLTSTTLPASGIA
jgi:hypothetical protein